MSVHVNPASTADLIVEYEGGIVLVKRKHPPFEGYWALPGGFLETGKEDLEQAAVRELREETSLIAVPSDLELICIQSKPGRDPRGHVISHVYYVKNYSGQPNAGDDAAEITIIPIKTALGLGLAFDHKEILQKFAELKNIFN